MAGTILADKIQADSTSTLEIMNGVALTPPRIEDVNGVQVGTFCRAWINFNGTGTPTARASFNVSSITDNGTGTYTINFTNALPDANFAFAGTFNTTGTASTASSNDGELSAFNLAVGSVSMITMDGGATKGDYALVTCAIFR